MSSSSQKELVFWLIELSKNYGKNASILASGLNRRAWCQEQNLPEHQLGYWLRKLHPNKIESGSNRWVAAESDCFSDTGVSLQIGDVVLSVKGGFDRQVLADVVSALMTVGKSNSIVRSLVYMLPAVATHLTPACS